MPATLTLSCEAPAKGQESASATSLRLVQLTDPHLFRDPEGCLLGMPTRAGFEAVLALALERSRPHALVVTGDLVHDESLAGYRLLRERLDATGLPCFCVAGNHDRWSLMRQVLGARALGPIALRELGPWRLVFLDSRLPGETGGRLSAEQFRALDERLSERQAPTLILLHHHPASVGCHWLDGMGVENGAELIALAQRHPGVRAILFGHIHQAFSAQLDGLSLLGAPATSVQFLPHSPTFALDHAPPGYRELCLHDSGDFDTRILRLARYPSAPCFAAQGY